MPEMCVGQEIRVAVIAKNASTATLKYCNRTQTQSCALASDYTQFVSVATSIIIEPRLNIDPVERNSQDKLEGTFPKTKMSLFLVSHSTKITLV
jgi:hypothetical protein